MRIWDYVRLHPSEEYWSFAKSKYTLMSSLGVRVGRDQLGRHLVVPPLLLPPAALQNVSRPPHVVDDEVYWVPAPCALRWGEELKQPQAAELNQ